MSKREASVIVHRYAPQTDSSIRLHWLPLYVEAGTIVTGSGSKPIQENVPVAQIVCVLQLHDGVISHACGRDLDRRGYRFADTELSTDANALPMEVMTEVPERMDSLARSAGATFTVGGVLPRSQDALGAPATGATDSVKVAFNSCKEFQQWISIKSVDFVEIFRGYGEATVRVREAGCTAADGFDNQVMTYGRSWHLNDLKVRGRLGMADRSSVAAQSGTYGHAVY